MVADRAGVATAFAMANLQERAVMMIEPATEVYEGMIVGENSRTNDLDVNITKEKKQTNMRASTADEAIRIVPPRLMGLEQAIEFINDDELVEITPKSIRLRKKILAGNMRPKKADDAWRGRAAFGSAWGATSRRRRREVDGDRHLDLDRLAVEQRRRELPAAHGLDRRGLEVGMRGDDVLSPR